MKKTLLSIITVTITLLSGLTVATAQNISQAVNKVLDSTVVLDLKNAEGRQTRAGRGFFIRHNYVVTNIHVVENVVSGYAQLVNENRKFKIVNIVRDDEHGLALLKVDASGVQPLILGNSNTVKYNDTVYVVGNMSASEIEVSEGTIMGRDVDNISASGQGSIIMIGDRVITGSYSGNAEWLRVTTQISRRMSGGPVLNSKGEIIGVATHRGGTGWEIGNYAVSSETVTALLTKHNVKTANPTPSVIYHPATPLKTTKKADVNINKSANRIERTYNVNPGGSLTVNSDIGNVDVQTTAQNRVEIVFTKKAKRGIDSMVQAALADFEVTVDATRSGVSIRGEFQRGRNYWQRQLSRLDIRFLVTVPRRYNVDLYTTSGNITTNSLTGEVQGHTSAGNIHVDDIIGPVQTQTSAGNLRFSGVKGPLSGRSSAGNITITNCQGSVDAKTSAGNVRAKMITQPRHQWILQTSAGNITGTLNSNVAVDIDARTSIGSLSTDFAVRGNVTRSRLHGTINGGGPLLKMRTSAGNIRLLRN